MLMIGRLLAAGGEPRRAAQTLLGAARQAFDDGSLTSAELLLNEAGRTAGSAEAEVGCLRAQVLLQAGRAAEAAGVAAHMVALCDGRDGAAATAMRLVLIRTAVMTGAWEEARLQVADLRRAAAAGQALWAELDVIEAQLALGDARPGSRERAEQLAAQAASTARAVGRPDLTCEALQVLGLAARLHDLDAAHRALARALQVAEAAGLRVHRLRVLNELGTVEMLRDARGGRLEQARREAARAGAVGLAVGIGANIAALRAMTAGSTMRWRWRAKSSAAPCGSA